jgi:hypothetical protein
LIRSCNVRNILRTLVLVASAVALPAPVVAQAVCPDPVATIGNVEPPLAAIRYLADDALEGRRAGTAGEHCATEFIAAEFARLGIEPLGENGTFFQSVPLASVLNPHAPGGIGRNVIGLLRGADTELSKEFVIIGAHHDHLGEGGFGSLAPGDRSIHNGADDNASGVAALLRAAQLLTAGRKPARSIVFMTFTGEESGLLGSAHFAGHATVPLSAVVGMLNMDMVGRLGDQPLIVYGVDTAEEWNGLLGPAASNAGVQLATRGEGYGPSDHTSFYARDIPVLHFFTNVHGDYHRPSDDWQRIDAPGIQKVAAIVTDVALRVADRRLAITLRRGAGQPIEPGQGRAQGSDAYLGSVPDFTPVERGVKLSGVSPGSPAEKAGLRSGDVLIGLGTHDVADLQGLTDALGAHKPGDTVEVRYLRDGRLHKLELVLGSRAHRNE